MPCETPFAAPCAAVVLAAGEARRFGPQKLLMPFGESTVIGSVVAALQAARIAPIIVVGGRDASEIARAVGDAAQVVPNPDPQRGMFSSIRTGVAALPSETASFLIVLGDQPRLSPSVVTQLRAAQSRTGRGVALPVYRGRRGHPIVLAAAYRPRILDLPEGKTLRDLLQEHRDDWVEVTCDSEAVICDIDTQEQYRDELRKSLAERDPRPLR